MSHDTPTIVAEPRDRTGTRYAQRLRKSGRMPAVIYGHKQDPVHVSVDAKEVISHLQHGAHVINVDVAGAKPETCLVKDLQFGFLGDNVIHVDFTRVDLDEEVTVNVHLHFIGELAHAKNAGAVVRHDMTELEVMCKVSEIPEEITVDLSAFESNVFVGDLTLPEGIKTELDPEISVARITYVEEEDTGEEAEMAADLDAEPEVITEAKSDDDSGASADKQDED